MIAACFLVGLAPTLAWEEAADPIEALNVATALEMRRGGEWIAPTLQGVPRRAKPPLTAWVTAGAIRPWTVAGLSSDEPAEREAAYRRLMWEVRWPALLAACGMVAATFEMGRALGGAMLGAASACVCGTTLLVLRYATLATVDVQLALWVAVGNAFLAWAVVRGRRWIGCIGAGVGLGMALMAKGPVAMAQSIVPFTIFALILSTRRCCKPRGAAPAAAEGESAGGAQRWAAPLMAGALLMVMIGGGWYAWVAWRHPHVASLWMAELTRVDADHVPASSPLRHVQSLYLFLPWLVWLGAGALLAVRVARRGTEAGSMAGAVLPLLLLAAPLVVMSLAKDRFPRYLLPLAPAGALLAGHALVEHYHGRPAGPRWAAAGRMAVAAHWLLLAVLAAGVPLIASTGRQKAFLTTIGTPWFSPAIGVGLAGAAVSMILLGAWLHRRWRGGIVVATTAVMLVGAVVYVHGQSRSPAGRSDLRPVAERIWRDYPDAELYMPAMPGQRNVINAGGNDLSIHLNRTARWASTMEQVPPSAHPRVWYTSRDRRAPDLPAPPGWRRLAKIQGGETKYVFVSDPPPRRDQTRPSPRAPS